MRRIPARLLPHTVSAKVYLGSGAYGDRWSPGEIIPRVLIEDETENVTDASGQTVVAGTKVFMEPRSIPVGSLVTVWLGSDLEREARVIQVSRFDHPQGMSHQVVYLK